MSAGIDNVAVQKEHGGVLGLLQGVVLHVPGDSHAGERHPLVRIVQHILGQTVDFLLVIARKKPVSIITLKTYDARIALRAVLHVFAPVDPVVLRRGKPISACGERPGERRVRRTVRDVFSPDQTFAEIVAVDRRTGIRSPVHQDIGNHVGIIRGVLRHAQPHLLETVDILRGPGAPPRLIQRRQQHRGKNRNDCNHNKKFN